MQNLPDIAEPQVKPRHCGDCAEWTIDLARWQSTGTCRWKDHGINRYAIACLAFKECEKHE
jgi:hypothetical protein